MTEIAVTSPTVRRWQVGLVIVGVALLLVGGVVLLNDVRPSRYPGLAVWLVGALVVHDGLAALGVFGVSILMRRAGRKIPVAVIAIVQGALAIAAIVTALVIPEILKQSIGSANPSILPLSYGLNLALFCAALAVLAGAAIAGYYAILARRQKLRPPTDHD